MVRADVASYVSRAPLWLLIFRSPSAR
jgi:hypothetical protein